jgi:hypothetical protein
MPSPCLRHDLGLRLTLGGRQLDETGKMKRVLQCCKRFVVSAVWEYQSILPNTVSGGTAMKEEKIVPVRPALEKKLALNKETIRVLTDREMMAVEGATCLRRTTCPVGLTSPGGVNC